MVGEQHKRKLRYQPLSSADHLHSSGSTVATKHDFSTFREVDMSHDLHDMDGQASEDVKSECTEIETRQIKK